MNNDTKRAELKGIIPVLVTPLDELCKPHEKGIKQLVDFLIGTGIGGFWALGSASEDINMSFASKVETAKLVSNANGGRVPLIMGAGLTAIDDIFHYFDHVSDLDLDGIHILPYDVKMGEQRVIHLFTTLADNSPFPIWLYHNPKRGRVITNNIINELKNHPNIAGIKMGGYNLSELTSAVMHKNENFDVIGAGSGQLFTMLSLGAKAHTTSEASVFPEPFVEIYDSFMNGRLQESRDKQFEMIRLSKQFPRTENGEYAAEEKYILSLRNICEEHVNPLYRKLSQDEKKHISIYFEETRL